MQGFSVPLPQRLFSSAGVPADGWLVYTKVANSDTDLTTYSDATLSTENNNPIECDTAGYFRCFVAEAVLVKLIVHDALDVLQFTLDNLEPMPNTSGSDPTVTPYPPGCLMPHGGSTAPTGFLLCNGDAVSRTTYSDLFGIIGTTYGSGNGSTTFNVPDCRGRFALGVAASGTGNALGDTGGAIDHTHSGPAHTHTATHIPGLYPYVFYNSQFFAPSQTGVLTVGVGASGDTRPFTLTTYQASIDQELTSSSGGTGDTSTANPAYVTANWIIKT